MNQYKEINDLIWVQNTRNTNTDLYAEDISK